MESLDADSTVSEPVSVPAPQVRRADTGIAGAAEGNLLALENGIGTKLKTKLSKLVNTGMEVPEKILATSREDVEKVRATALYNDGSTASKAVNLSLIHI